jgi:hypothetical protein
MVPNLFTHLGWSVIRPWAEIWQKSNKSCIARKCKKLIVTEGVISFKLSELFISVAKERSWATVASEEYCKCISNLILFYRYDTARISLIYQPFWCREPSAIPQWPCGLRNGSAAPRLLGLPVRIPAGTFMPVVIVLCVCVCQPEVSASGWPLVRRGPTECDGGTS